MENKNQAELIEKIRGQFLSMKCLDKAYEILQVDNGFSEEEKVFIGRQFYMFLTLFHGNDYHEYRKWTDRFFDTENVVYKVVNSYLIKAIDHESTAFLESLVGTIDRNIQKLRKDHIIKQQEITRFAIEKKRKEEEARKERFAAISKQHAAGTVAEIALLLGCSKAEVRRLKQTPGALEEAIAEKQSKSNS